jgi:hypothetical protein
MTEAVFTVKASSPHFKVTFVVVARLGNWSNESVSNAIQIKCDRKGQCTIQTVNATHMRYHFPGPRIPSTKSKEAVLSP